MSQPIVFPYRIVSGPFPVSRPLIEVTLKNGTSVISEFGLVDSGSDTCVLPYSLGLQLRLNWNQLPVLPSPGGILSTAQTRAALLDAEIKPFPSLRLAFAWVQRDDLPLILGQVNFFLEFDVCFFRSRDEFQIQPATP